MITIVVPPSLPLALTVGVAYALVALRRASIFCVSPPRVNLAGKVNVFCFDKTGTLTADGLELTAVVPATNGIFSDATKSRAEAGDGILAVSAACHALTRVDDTLLGDPLELQTFAFSGAKMSEPNAVAVADTSSRKGAPSSSVHSSLAAVSSRAEAARVDIAGPVHGDDIAHVAIPAWQPGGGGEGSSAAWTGAVIYRFEFVPALQRMCVIVRVTAGCSPQLDGSEVPVPASGGQLVSLVKGSPEMVLALSRKESVPHDATSVLREYTHRGYRVLAVGWKAYTGPDPNGASDTQPDALRAAAESDLTFLGYVVLENALKPESTGVLARLRTEAEMPLYMVTGDNPGSAVAIARQCGLVEPGVRVYLGDVEPPMPPPPQSERHHLAGPDANVAGDDARRAAIAAASGSHGYGATGNGATTSVAPHHVALGVNGPYAPTVKSGASDPATSAHGIVWRDVDDEHQLLDEATLLPRGADRSGNRSVTPYRLAITMVPSPEASDRKRVTGQ